MKILFTLVSAMLLLSGNIYAKSPPKIFDTIDADADGCISKEEAKVRPDIVKSFAKIDKDKGGTICIDEYTEYQNRREGNFSPEDYEAPEVGASPVM